MKNLFAALLLSILFISCTKERQTTIIGTWKPVARFGETQFGSGTFIWVDLSRSRFFSIMTLTQEGRYSFFSDVSEGYGNFEYNVSRRQLIFSDAVRGSRQVTEVSHLDAQYLVVDYYYNGGLIAKLKYTRIK
jgi:hypothetical protein